MGRVHRAPLYCRERMGVSLLPFLHPYRGGHAHEYRGRRAPGAVRTGNGGPGQAAGW